MYEIARPLKIWLETGDRRPVWAFFLGRTFDDVAQGYELALIAGKDREYNKAFLSFPGMWQPDHCYEVDGRTFIPFYQHTWAFEVIEVKRRAGHSEDDGLPYEVVVRDSRSPSVIYQFLSRHTPPENPFIGFIVREFPARSGAKGKLVGEITRFIDLDIIRYMHGGKW